MSNQAIQTLSSEQITQFLVAWSGGSPFTSYVRNVPPYDTFTWDGSKLKGDTGLSAAQVAATQQGSTKALKMYFGRYGTITNDPSGFTYHLIDEVPFEFDGVQIVLANGQLSGTQNMQCGFAVCPDFSDINFNGGTYSQPGWSLFSGSNVVAAPAFAPGASRYSYLISDLLNVQSIPRTDGLPGAIYCIRTFTRVASTVFSSWGANAADTTLTNWATKPLGTGRRVSRRQIGQFLSPATGFTSTTNIADNPIAGVIFWCRGAVVNIAKFGDSLTQGRGTYIGEGFVGVAARNASSTKVSVSDFAISGTASSEYGQVAVDVMTALGSYIDIAVYASGSPNNVSTTIDATAVRSGRTPLINFMQATRANKPRVMLLDWAPSNPASATPAGVKNYLGTDSLRRDWNTALPSLGATCGANVLPVSAAFSGASDGNGQTLIGAGLTSDGIHPNDAGESAMAAACTALASFVR